MGINFGSARDVPTWQPEPAGRGTYSILSTCLITIVLCLWTAVHLNIPEHKSIRRRTNSGSAWDLRRTQWCRRLGMILLGLFAPEVTAWVAFEQNRAARKLCREMKSILGELHDERPIQGGMGSPRSPSRSTDDLEFGGAVVTGEGVIADPNITPSRVFPGSEGARLPTTHPSAGSDSWSETSRRRSHKWTITHSHYAAMGGFAFDSSALGVDMLPNGRKRVTLTTLGLLQLAETAPHLVPDISGDHIRDKSKASYLAKTIVMLQASWFATQCICRLALGMTISLLELNTFAHAVCTLLAYALWWHKPLDVEEPTIIQGRDVDMICAGLCMRSAIGARCVISGISNGWRKRAILHWKTDPPGAVTTDPWELRIRSLPNSEPERPVGLHGDHRCLGSEQSMSSGKDSCSTVPPRRHIMFMGQRIFGFRFLPEAPGRVVVAELAESCGVLGLHRPAVELTCQDLNRLRQASACYNTYPELLETLAVESKSHQSGELSPRQYYLQERIIHLYHLPHNLGNGWIVDFVVDRAPNLPLRRRGHGSSWTVFPTLSLAGLVYGGLHLLAWNPPLTTWPEIIMWRVSGLSFIGYAVGIPIHLVMSEVSYKGLSAVVFEKLRNTDRFFKNRLERDSARGWSMINTALKATINVLIVACEVFVFPSPVRDINRLTLVAVMVIWLIIIPVYLIGTVVHAMARLYVIVECFISVPRFPASVFETPSWSRYVPHLN